MSHHPPGHQRVSPHQPVVSAGPDEASATARLIAEAFHPLDAARWLVPPPHARQTILAAQFHILVEHAFSFGAVEVLADRSAVAVWFDRTRDIPAPPGYDERLAAACGHYTDRFVLLDNLFDDHHPSQPHHHLALLAVTPGKQGAGRGTALLRHHHAALDRAGLPAYLEASSLASRDLYARHGYQDREIFHLPDGSAFYPMWRPAREVGAAEMGAAEMGTSGAGASGARTSDAGASGAGTSEAATRLQRRS